MKDVTSLSPYFLRGFYEWSLDNNLTALINVAVDDEVIVPNNFVVDGAITLNIGPEACVNLNLGNDYVTFSARFGGKEEFLKIPVGRISAIFVRESGFGIPFEVVESSKKDEPKRGFVKIDTD